MFRIMTDHTAHAARRSPSLPLVKIFRMALAASLLTASDESDRLIRSAMSIMAVRGGSEYEHSWSGSQRGLVSDERILLIAAETS